MFAFPYTKIITFKKIPVQDMEITNDLLFVSLGQGPSLVRRKLSENGKDMPVRRSLPLFPQPTGRCQVITVLLTLHTLPTPRGAVRRIGV